MRSDEEQILDQHFGVGEPIEQRPDFWGNGLNHCIIIGSGSDIGKELDWRLRRDGWHTTPIAGRYGILPAIGWDLVIIAIGTMEPIGKFFDCEHSRWEYGVTINAFVPLANLRRIWPNRRMGARVVFMSGPNPNVPTPSYTAYRAGKAVLESLVSTLNAEYPEHKFLWLIPGVVATKIHAQTIAAGDRAANLDRAKRIMSGEEPTHSHDEVYERLRALLA